MECAFTIKHESYGAIYFYLLLAMHLQSHRSHVALTLSEI